MWHGIIGLVKVGLECGLIELPDGQDVVRIDTPAGRVTATAHREGDRVERVSFHNVPSFLHARDLELELPGHGSVRCDVGYVTCVTWRKQQRHYRALSHECSCWV